MKNNKHIYLSAFAATMLFTTSAIADSSSIEEAISKAKVNGDITLYGESIDKSGGNADAGMSMTSLGLSFETDSYNGFKAAVSFRTNHKINEKESGDYSDGSEPKSLLSVANISYENSDVSLIAGRQEIDLEWLGDFNEAALGTIKFIPNTTITAAHVNRQAVADTDAALTKMTKVNGSKGVSVFDISYSGIENLSINPYYYRASSLANWGGIKLGYSTDMFSLSAHTAKSDEKAAGTADGSISHFEIGGEASGVGLSVGYITTDNDGIGSMSAAGENVNPLEDGNQVYVTNADTTYFSATYELNVISLGAMYGTTDYAANSEEKELNLMAGYSYNDNLSISAVYVDVDAQSASDDYDKITLTLAYTF